MSSDIDMTLDELSARDGLKGRGRRHQRSAPRKTAPPPETVTPAQRQQRIRGRRLMDKAEVVPVVFGNGTPEKVLTGRLSDSMIGGKEPVNLVQAALARGTEMFLKNRAKIQGQSPSKSRGDSKGGKRQSTGGAPRKRRVLQRSLVRKLRIVRPSDPGYTRELQQLRNNTYAVRMVRQSRNSRSRRGSSDSSSGRAGSKGRRSGPSTAPVSAGPLSDRFSSISHK